MRGEYPGPTEYTPHHQELPPRARRIQLAPQQKPGKPGTTSACAENTGQWSQPGSYRRNYLRVRGEYVRMGIVFTRISELPPRARRIRIVMLLGCGMLGTTSACAENTRPGWRTSQYRWNYLRVRGEYWRNANEPGTLAELPPRARRILFTVDIVGVTIGTTSACAENTLNELGLL